MPFTEANDDPRYTHGFECGRVWSLMESKTKIDNYAFHSANIEQFRRMAITLGYEIEVHKIDHTWAVFSGHHVDQLEQALTSENYELAAKIRDEKILNRPNGANTINMKADDYYGR